MTHEIVSATNQRGVIAIVARLASGKLYQYLVDSDDNDLATVEADFRNATRLADVAEKYQADVEPLSRQR